MYVECKYYHEWVFVKHFYGMEPVSHIFPGSTCIDINKPGCTRNKTFLSSNSILSFDDWCANRRIDNPFHSYNKVLCVNTVGNSRFKKGTIYECNKISEAAFIINGVTHTMVESKTKFVPYNEPTIGVREEEEKIPKTDDLPYDVGDTVRIKDTKHIRSWYEGAEAIGDTFTIILSSAFTLEDFYTWVKGDYPSSVPDGRNYYSINYLPSDLEKVEPSKSTKDPESFKFANSGTKEEYNPGDWVYLSVKPMVGNALKFDGSEDGIYQLLAINESKNPTGHLPEESHFMFKKKDNKYYRTNKKNIIRKATPDEISKLKIKAKYAVKVKPKSKKEMKFTVGQKVRFTGLNYRGEVTEFKSANLANIIHGSAEVHSRYDAYIVDIQGQYYIVNYLDQHQNRVQLGFKEKSLKYTDGSEDFRAGDYITILKGFTNWAPDMTQLVGQTFKVTEIHPNGNSARFSKGRGFVWNYNQGHFRRATSGEIAKCGGEVSKELLLANTGKFKVGDKVKVTRIAASYEGNWQDAWDSDMDDFVGDTAEITDSAETSGYELDGEYWFPEFVLELHEDPVKKKRSSTVAALVPIPIGSKVRYKGTDTTVHAYYSEDGEYTYAIERTDGWTPSGRTKYIAGKLDSTKKYWHVGRKNLIVIDIQQPTDVIPENILMYDGQPLEFKDVGAFNIDSTPISKSIRPVSKSVALRKVEPIITKVNKY